MKNLAIFIAIIAMPIICNAQKHDNKWLFGYSAGGSDKNTMIDFSTDSIFFKTVFRKMQLDNHYAAINDSVGNIAAYTNGCYLANATGDTIENGNDINPGPLANLFCGTDNLIQANNLPQSGFFIPVPNKSSQYMLFQIGYDNHKAQNLSYSLIDMNENNGKGKVIEKNIKIIESELGLGMAAVKHANGRDWWMVVNKYRTNQYYIVLMQPDGFEVFSQEIGEPFSIDVNKYEILFSPDGKKLAAYHVKDDLRLFDFDRCKGILSHAVFIPKKDSADMLNTITGGCAFSLDSRFVYVSEGRVHCYQYDTWATDIGASKDTVAVFDGYTSFGPANFGLMELGPDGRIYCRSTVGSSYEMHVINNPERKGDACDFRQHEYILEYPIASMPMHPNYRLGAVDGSACDTLGIDNHPVAGFRYDRSLGLAVDFTSVSWYEPDTWLWDFGDGQTSTEVNPTHFFPKTGFYYVCLTVCNQFSCDTICKWVWVATALDTPVPKIDKNGVSIFPNPTRDYLNIFMENPTAQNFSVKIYDLLGRLVKSQPTDYQQVFTGDLVDGIYRIHIFKDNRLVHSSNFIKVK